MKPNKSKLKQSHDRIMARLIDSGELVNLYGNYDYMSKGYYLSLDYELNGHTVKPGCKEMIDAYVPPIFLEKAKLAGIAIPEYYISNGHFDPPVIVDPVNPFTLKGTVVLKPVKVKSISKSLTRNFTYAVCCQEIPEGSKIRYFKSVLGWSLQPEFLMISSIVWNHFNIPLARVRVIQTKEGELLLSDISPLFLENLGVRETNYLNERIQWDS